MNVLAKTILSGFGVGYVPFGPGFWAATLLTAALFMLGACSERCRRHLRSVMFCIGLSTASACVYWGRSLSELFGSKDPSACVADEWAGLSLAYALLPSRVLTKLTRAVLLSVWISFMVFDGLKIPPSGAIEELPDGWGVLLDDVVAAVYACLLGWLLTVWMHKASRRSPVAGR